MPGREGLANHLINLPGVTGHDGATQVEEQRAVMEDSDTKHIIEVTSLVEQDPTELSGHSERTPPGPCFTD